jgi:ATP-dependent Clp protease adaptor protein ClpS
MAKKKKDEEAGEGGSESAAATKPKRAKKSLPKPQPPQMLPPWKVLLHNDDKNSMEHVVGTIIELTPLKKEDAVTRTLEAHETGVSLILTTHKERAELYKEQFESKSLIVTIEPAE